MRTGSFFREGAGRKRAAVGQAGQRKTRRQEALFEGKQGCGEKQGCDKPKMVRTGANPAGQRKTRRQEAMFEGKQGRGEKQGCDKPKMVKAGANQSVRFPVT